MNTIETLRFWCHKILPLVYDESLSYYEVLCKFRAKLNEMVNAINQQNSTIEEFTQTVLNWEQEVEEKIDEKIETALADLEQRLTAEFETWFNDFKSDTDDSVESMLSSYAADFDAKLIEIQGDFDDAMTEFTNTFNAWFDEQEQTIQTTVEEYADQYMQGLDDRVTVLEEEVDGTGGLADTVSGNTTAIGLINSQLNHLWELTTVASLKPIPNTYTSYEVHWDDYDYLIIEPIHYWSAFGNSMYARQRIADSEINNIDLWVSDVVNGTNYAIAKLDTTHLYVKSSGSHANEANYGLRIYGIKIKG